MSLTKIKIVRVGHIPFEINKKKISAWKSRIFKIDPVIENYPINSESDGPYWSFSDTLLEREIPYLEDYDITISLLNVPLEGNYYSRRLSNNRVCLTLYEIQDILRNHNIPIENLILRMSYAYSIIFKRFGNRMPVQSEFTNYAHDDTRGCLFDMNGIKSDIIHSCHNPILCDDCKYGMRTNNFSLDYIKWTESEINKIKKHFSYRVIDSINRRPILSLVLTVLFTLGISLLGAYIYDLIK